MKYSCPCGWKTETPTFTYLGGRNPYQINYCPRCGRKIGDEEPQVCQKCRRPIRKEGQKGNWFCRCKDEFGGKE